MADTVAPPEGTFRGFVAEGTRLYHRGEYTKALLCFQKALKLRAGDKDCLVACSECHLRLGDIPNALRDAEASLQHDKTFAKGLYQKAEALYAMGDFEAALIFYHRGRRAQPKRDRFRLGVQRSEEAIFGHIARLSTLLLEEKEAPHIQGEKGTEKLRWEGSEEPGGKPQAGRGLQGALDAHEAILEELFEDGELMEKRTDRGMELSAAFASGLSYLDIYSKFWKEEKPCRHAPRRLGLPKASADKEAKLAELPQNVAEEMESRPDSGGENAEDNSKKQQEEEGSEQSVENREDREQKENTWNEEEKEEGEGEEKKKKGERREEEERSLDDEDEEGRSRSVLTACCGCLPAPTW